MRSGLMSLCLPGVVLAALTAVTLGEDKKEEKIPLDKVPRAVMEAINARFPGANVESVERETEAGKVVYDVELKHKSRKYEMDIHEDGTVVELEKEVAAEDVPEAVRKAVRAEFPRAKVREFMEVNRVKGKDETPIHYEVTLSINGKEREVVVSLDGKVLKRPETGER